MYRYIILPEAAEELDHEIAHSRRNWGAVHASQYRRELMQRVRNIAKNPKLYPINPDFGEELRSVQHKGNRIIYRIDESKKCVVFVGFPSIYVKHH
jgi:plasmid stabilization system protein ParE